MLFASLHALYCPRVVLILNLLWGCSHGIGESVGPIGSVFSGNSSSCCLISLFERCISCFSVVFRWLNLHILISCGVQACFCICLPVSLSLCHFWLLIFSPFGLLRWSSLLLWSALVPDFELCLRFVDGNSLLLSHILSSTWMYFS